MFLLSGLQEQALGQSHTAIFRADVLRANQKVAELLLTGGDVTSEESIAIQSNTRFTLVDPTGELTVTSATDLLAPYGTEVMLWRGVDTNDPDHDLIPQGVFRITINAMKDSAQGGIETQLTGYDRAQPCEGSLARALAIPAGQPYEQALEQMLLEKLPTLSFQVQQTGLKSPPLLLPTTKNVWTEARRIARSFGCRLFMNRIGICCLVPIAVTAQKVKVWAYTDGDDGNAWDFDRQVSSDQLVNTVVVRGTHSGNSGTVQGEARDLDPKSPTYANGTYGEVVYSEDSELVTTVGQAQEMAKGILAQKLGAGEVVSFSAIPNPALDIGDTITVNRPSLGLEQREMIVSKIVMPLDVTTPMSITCRRSILTEQDGFQSTVEVDA